MEEEAKTNIPTAPTTPGAPPTETTDFKKRNIAYKLRIGDVLNGSPKMEEGRFLFLELGEKKVVRIIKNNENNTNAST